MQGTSRKVDRTQGTGRKVDRMQGSGRKIERIEALAGRYVDDMTQYRRSFFEKLVQVVALYCLEIFIFKDIQSVERR